MPVLQGKAAPRETISADRNRTQDRQKKKATETKTIAGASRTILNCNNDDDIIIHENGHGAILSKKVELLSTPRTRKSITKNNYHFNKFGSQTPPSSRTVTMTSLSDGTKSKKTRARKLNHSFNSSNDISLDKKPKLRGLTTGFVINVCRTPPINALTTSSHKKSSFASSPIGKLLIKNGSKAVDESPFKSDLTQTNKHNGTDQDKHNVLKSMKKTKEAECDKISSKDNFKQKPSRSISKQKDKNDEKEESSEPTTNRRRSHRLSNVVQQKLNESNTDKSVQKLTTNINKQNYKQLNLNDTKKSFNNDICISEPNVLKKEENNSETQVTQATPKKPKLAENEQSLSPNHENEDSSSSLSSRQHITILQLDPETQKTDEPHLKRKSRRRSDEVEPNKELDSKLDKNTSKCSENVNKKIVMIEVNKFINNIGASEETILKRKQNNQTEKSMKETVNVEENDEILSKSNIAKKHTLCISKQNNNYLPARDETQENAEPTTKKRKSLKLATANDQLKLVETNKDKSITKCFENVGKQHDIDDLTDSQNETNALSQKTIVPITKDIDDTTVPTQKEHTKTRKSLKVHLTVETEHILSNKNIENGPSISTSTQHNNNSQPTDETQEIYEPITKKRRGLTLATASVEPMSKNENVNKKRNTNNLNELNKDISDTLPMSVTKKDHIKTETCLKAPITEGNEQILSYKNIENEPSTSTLTQHNNSSQAIDEIQENFDPITKKRRSLKLPTANVQPKLVKNNKDEDITKCVENFDKQNDTNEPDELNEDVSISELIALKRKKSKQTHNSIKIRMGAENDLTLSKTNIENELSLSISKQNNNYLPANDEILEDVKPATKKRKRSLTRSTSNLEPKLIVETNKAEGMAKGIENVDKQHNAPNINELNKDISDTVPTSVIENEHSRTQTSIETPITPENEQILSNNYIENVLSSSISTQRNNNSQVIKEAHKKSVFKTQKRKSTTNVEPKLKEQKIDKSSKATKLKTSIKIERKSIDSNDGNLYNGEKIFKKNFSTTTIKKIKREFPLELNTIIENNVKTVGHEASTLVVNVANPIVKASNAVEIKSPVIFSEDSAKEISVKAATDLYTTGDLFWGQCYNYCYWPCMVCGDPDHGNKTMFNTKVHVRFFADNARRSYIKPENLIRYEGLANYQEKASSIKESYNKKHPKYQLFVPKPSQQKVWIEAINEANILLNTKFSERWEIFCKIYENSKVLQKLERKRRKSMSVATTIKSSLSEKRERSPSPESPAFSPIRPASVPANIHRGSIEKNDEKTAFTEIATKNYDQQLFNDSKQTEETQNNIDKIDTTTIDLLEESNRRYSHRIIELTKRRSETALIPEPKPELPSSEKEVAVKRRGPLNRPIEEVIDDIYSLDSKYLFRSLAQYPICKYCLQTGGNILKCSKTCGCWLHPDCIMKDQNTAHVTAKSIKGRRSKSNNKNSDIDKINNNTINQPDLDKPTSSKNASLSTSEKEDKLPMDFHITAETEIIVCVECKSTNKNKCTQCHRDNYEIGTKMVCKMQNCHRTFHHSCGRKWPQSKINVSKNRIESFRCPSHVCHTCVSDDPQGKFQNLRASKLTRCIKCPASYHCDSTCIPAGSQVLSTTCLICPRHYWELTDTRCNVNWCFICVTVGPEDQVVCCETCPIAVHKQCATSAANSGDKYFCEECESGRLPLYGEMVWAKFNTYRWWPAIILPPTEIPQNILKIPHNPGDFVVRFFGSHDHGWISRRRVYLYVEGDSSAHVKTQTTLDTSFVRGIREAKHFYDIIQTKKKICELKNRNKEELHPQPYVRIKTNRPVPPLKFHIDLEIVNKCECSPWSEDPCGFDSNCLNRVLYHECNPKICPAGIKCQNQMFESRVSPQLKVVYMNQRGFGLICLEAIKAGYFVIEYVGEAINDFEFKQRMKQKSQDRDENYYFLSVEKDYIIDAGPRGNLARFMNHSCDPNCETQKWTVNGINRIGLFAIKDIPENTELTFNYRWDELLGKENRMCYCGAEKCLGRIGQKEIKEDKQKADTKTKSKPRSQKTARNKSNTNQVKKVVEAATTSKETKKSTQDTNEKVVSPLE